MKHQLILLLGLGFLLSMNACGPKDPVEPDVPKLSCYLKSYSYTSKEQYILSRGNPTTFANEETRTTLFTYDANGRMTGRSVQWYYSRNELYNTIKHTYTYDEAGYLTASTMEENGREGTRPWTRAHKNSYTYQNGLLSLVKVVSTTSGKTIRALTFTYDAQSQLTKMIDWPEDHYDKNNTLYQEVYTFENGTLKTFLSPPNSGQPDTYVLVSPGYVQKYSYDASGDTYSYLYDYDLKGRLTRRGWYKGNQELSRSLFTYDDSGKEAIDAIPKLKGFPDVPALRSMAYLFEGYADTGMPNWNLEGIHTQIEPLSNKWSDYQTNKWVEKSSGMGRYIRNAQGFPEEYNYTANYNDGYTAVTTSKTTTRIVYAYENCQ